MDNTLLIILIIAGAVLFIAQRMKHKKELAELAKESSDRIQEYHTKLVKVCMEPDSMEAKQIIYGVTFKYESEKTLWMGGVDPIPNNEKGIWGQIKEQADLEQ